MALDETLKDTILANIKTRPEEVRYKIKDLHDDLNSGDLVINPEYQRNYLYEGSDKIPSKLVESVFMGLIIPEIQLFSDTETMRDELIDGQQRVLSLVRFYTNEFSLKGLECLPELNGYYYRDLPKPLQKAFQEYALNARLVRKECVHKYDLFARLNTGSKPLNAQEIRNVVYYGPMIRLAKQLAEHPAVVRLLMGLTNERQARVELVLRLLALFYQNGDMVRNSPSGNVNYFLELNSVKDMTPAQLKLWESAFLQATTRVLALIEPQLLNSRTAESKALISKSQLEPFMSFVYRYPEHYDALLARKTEVNEVLTHLITSDVRYLRVSIPTGNLFGRQMIQARQALVTETLLKLLGPTDLTEKGEA